MATEQTIETRSYTFNNRTHAQAFGNELKARGIRATMNIIFAEGSQPERCEVLIRYDATAAAK